MPVECPSSSAISTAPIAIAGALIRPRFDSSAQSLQPGQVAVDIGCHKGAYTYWMRRRVGASGAVYAFEPQPKQVAYLREAFSAMRYDNVAIVPMAVSNHCGEMPLYVPDGAGKTHAATLGGDE